jgi:hypothetical protein
MQLLIVVQVVLVVTIGAGIYVLFLQPPGGEEERDPAVPEPDFARCARVLPAGSQAVNTVPSAATSGALVEVIPSLEHRARSGARTVSR